MLDELALTYWLFSNIFLFNFLFLDVSGCQDGSVRMWEWSHGQAVQNVRPAGVFAKVNRLRFTQQGNKFGVADGDGNVVLWQSANAAQSFFVSILYAAWHWANKILKTNQFSNLMSMFFSWYFRLISAIQSKPVTLYFKEEALVYSALQVTALMVKTLPFGIH